MVEINPFSVTVKFDDGETSDLNATGNIVKEIPQILIELDPSYTFYKDKMTVWGSFSYFGKRIQIFQMPFGLMAIGKLSQV